MNPLTMSVLAVTFKVIGVITAVPSVAALMLCIAQAIRRLSGTPISGSTNFGSSPDALLLILKGITEIFGFLGKIGSVLEQFIFGILAALAFIGLMFGVACWFTGRGLNAQANWARISAFILILLAMIPSLLFALSANSVTRLVLCGIVILGGGALHTIWNGYPPQIP